MQNFLGKLFTITLNVFIAVALYIGFYALYADFAHADTQWTPETEKKLTTMVNMGFYEPFARSLITECKATATNPVLCIKLGASIAGAESSMAKKCYKNNCVGMGGGSFHYASISEGVRDWVKRYNKYWYKQKNPDAFYPKRGGTSVTRYCTDEHSSGSKKGCPNGNRHAWKVFNSLSHF